MLKRENRIFALLVAASAIVSTVGVNAADIKRINSEEGTIYNAVAYADGKAYVDGEINDEEAAYYSADGNFTVLDDINSGDDVALFGEKYLDVDDGDYTVDLSSGIVTDNDIVRDTANATASDLRMKIKDDTDDRYDEESTNEVKDDGTNFDELNVIPGAKYGPIWYATTYSQASNGVSNGYADLLNVFIDTYGNYIDADYNLGKIKITTTSAGTSKTVTVEDTDDTYDAANKSDALSVSVSQDKLLAQDNSYIYRLVTVEVNVADSVTSISEINGIRIDAEAFLTNNHGQTVKFKAIQKISKVASSNDIDGANYAKTVTTYALSDDDGNYLNSYNLINDYDTNFTVVDGKLIAYNTADEGSVTVNAYTLKSSNGYYYVDEEDESREDCEYNYNQGSAVQTDVNGNLWRLDGGYIYKFDNTDDWDKVYRVDGSMDELSVYDSENMVAWSEDDEFYSLINKTTITSVIKASEVKLDNTSLSLIKGNTSTLTATVSPSNVSNKSVIWSSSDTKVAKVDNNGKVTAVGAGEAVIKCITTDGSKKSSTCKVTVINPINIIDIKLNNTNLSIEKGKTSTLTVAVSPSNASNKAVTWSSSNTKVATVDANGKVTAVGAGTATITCTANDGSKKSAASKVTVTNPISVTGIKLNNTNLSMEKGKTSILTVAVSPSNASNKAVTWSSSNTKVATVDANGKVTAVGAGTATITCTAKDGSKKSAVSKVTVTNPVAVTGIKLNNTNLSMEKGKTSILTATVSPSNASNKGVTWSSSNTKVATVDANGKVTAVGAGTATITCTAKDGSKKSAVSKVIVTNPVAVTSIKLSKTSLSIAKGKTSTLTATISPNNASNKAVVWSSSNTKVAKVDDNGKIAAVAAGTAVITCTTKDGSKKSVICKVTVTK